MSKQKKIQPEVKPSIQPAIKKSAAWKPYLALTIFAFILYSNTLNHFYTLDDGIVLVNNQFTQQGIKGIPDIFKYDSFIGKLLNDYKEKTVDQIKKETTTVAGGRYRPLSLATFALEIQFFGKTVRGYDFKGNAFISHLNNILLYLFTTCLLYLILCRLFPPSLNPLPLNPLPLNPLKGTLERCTTSSIRMARGKWFLSFPFIVSVLFLAHPIHTEVVANIKGRDEIMTLLGALAALWFTIKYFDTNKNYNLWLSGLCLFLGLLSKENAITFLAVIPITIYYFIPKSLTPKSPKGDFGLCSHSLGSKGDFGLCSNSPFRGAGGKGDFGRCSDSPFRGSGGKDGSLSLFRGAGGKSMIPLVLASAVFLLIRASVLGVNVDTSKTITEILNNPFANATKSETFATIFYTLFLYVKLLFFPHPLTWDYYPHHIEIVNWSNPIAILSLLFYLGIIIYAIKRKPPLNPPVGGKSSPYGGVRGGGLSVISWSIWLYLLPLSIVSNLFFPIGVFMGERFIFISSIGFCIFIGWLIYTCLPKITKNKKNSTYLISLVLIIILGLYSAKTIDRNKAWKDEYTLYTTDIKTSKNSAKGNFHVADALMGKAFFSNNKNDTLQKERLCDELFQHLERAIELHPTYIEAIIALGNIFFECDKDVSASLQCYSTVLLHEKKALKSAKIVLNQTVMLLLNENPIVSTPDEILQSCDKLLKVKPDFWEAYYVKGMVYGICLKNTELSLENFEKAESFNFEKTEKFYEDIDVCFSKTIINNGEGQKHTN